MAKLTIVASIKVKSDQVDFVKSQLENLVPITREEAGCVQYDLHQDNENPAHFLFFEIWDSRELWQDHTNNDHIKAYQAATEGMVEEFVLHELTHIA
ncbi:putative quinol monooxygenase [Rhodopirellula halodulae]|uniref:putative quinol monooxygenase n=1 Tax=Rhodopirellula halodulae TaxID=2894198 RepID=UPI001E399A83|nr:antibiotic biosynthesis monooxygenase [Rhodopirellula sp. JC737]MCC9655025.1 antibiotic biosynthesis monooxygenase [Rhodopirellula sp. JC737]